MGNRNGKVTTNFNFKVVFGNNPFGHCAQISLHFVSSAHVLADYTLVAVCM